MYTVVVYNLRTIMREDNPGLNYFKGDNYLGGEHPLRVDSQFVIMCIWCRDYVNRYKDYCSYSKY